MPEDVRDDSGLYLVQNAITGGAVEFAVEGKEETPGGDRFADLRDVRATMNANGLIAFAAPLRTGSATNDSAIYAGHYSYTRTRLLREGDAAPGGGVFPDFVESVQLLALNDSGQVAFTAQVEPYNYSVFRIRTGEPAELVIRSETAAAAESGGEDGRFSGMQRKLVLNNDGQVAFLSGLAETSRGIHNDSGIFRAGAGGTVSIAREGQAAGYVGEFADMGVDASELSINNQGLVAFYAHLSGTENDNRDDEGIFLSDGEHIEVVAVEGSRLGDSSRVVHGLGDRCMRTGALNDAGQLAFVAELGGGAQGVFLFTPVVGYGPPAPYPPGAENPWDSPKYWEFGQLPRPIHPVRLFAEQDLTIDGPAEQTTIKSLVINAAEKTRVHLRLDQGPLVIRDTLDVGPRGSVDLGSMLDVKGKVRNRGTIVNSGGTFMVRSGLTNTDLGSISGSGLFHLPGGMINRGRLELKNAATVIGPVTHEGGVLLIHEDATVAFHGDVTASNPFEGSGQAAFGAGLHLGNEQVPTVEVRFGGDVRFGPDASLEIDLGGPKSGGFDVLAISGYAELDGTLTVRPLDEYLPKAGDQFKIMTAKKISGNFAKVKTRTPFKGLTFKAENRASALMLTVVAESDQAEERQD